VGFFVFKNYFTEMNYETLSSPVNQLPQHAVGSRLRVTELSNVTEPVRLAAKEKASVRFGCSNGNRAIDANVSSI
jgi:hypothetical protein